MGKKIGIVLLIIMLSLSIISGLLYYFGFWEYILSYSRSELTIIDTSMEKSVRDESEIGYTRGVVLSKLANNEYLIGTQNGLMKIYLPQNTPKKVLISRGSLSQKENVFFNELVGQGLLTEDFQDESNIYLMGEAKMFDELIETGSLVEIYYNKITNRVTIINLLKKRVHV